MDRDLRTMKPLFEKLLRLLLWPFRWWPVVVLLLSLTSLPWVTASRQSAAPPLSYSIDWRPLWEPPYTSAVVPKIHWGILGLEWGAVALIAFATGWQRRFRQPANPQAT